MTGSAAALISRRVIAGGVEDRLTDVAERIDAANATHCAVVDEGKFAGLIRLGEVCRYPEPGRRILGDLVADVSPMQVRYTESAETVSRLFRQHQLYEAVIVDAEDKYLGVATSESVLAWALDHLHRQEELLQFTRQELNAATSARDTFIRTLSHDLRTPLNPVLMVASDGASNTDYPEEVREQFQLITIHALLEAQLIDRLLETGKAERETVRLELAKVDLRSVLLSSVDQIHQSHPTWSVVLNDHGGPASVSVHGDAEKLGQAFRNILQYLFQETAAPASIEVSLSFAQDPSSFILTFARHGFGLTRMQLARAFETGSGHPGTPLTTIEHLSLGLSFAHAVVALHKGYLDLDSEGPSRGIRIEVALPVSKE